MIDLPGQALHDYYFQHSKCRLLIHNQYGKPEEMPVKVYFRNLKSMTSIEMLALSNCYGSVLDIGAGAGIHSLVLQQKGIEVTALEISPLACKVMKERGINKVICNNIFKYKKKRFDTLLLLMNGVGLTGTIENLKRFLQHSKLLLNNKGQLIFDSSDVGYLYKERNRPTKNYFGEIAYQYEYKKQKGDWFKWLYIDKKTLIKIANGEGYKTEILLEDEYGQYLARLVVK